MKHGLVFRLLAAAMAMSLAVIGAARAEEGFNELISPEQRKAELMALYGENKPITDDSVDPRRRV